MLQFLLFLFIFVFVFGFLFSFDSFIKTKQMYICFTFYFLLYTIKISRQKIIFTNQLLLREFLFFLLNYFCFFKFPSFKTKSYSLRKYISLQSKFLLQKQKEIIWNLFQKLLKRIMNFVQSNGVNIELYHKFIILQKKIGTIFKYFTPIQFGKIHSQNFYYEKKIVTLVSNLKNQSFAMKISLQSKKIRKKKFYRICWYSLYFFCFAAGESPAARKAQTEAKIQI